MKLLCSRDTFSLECGPFEKEVIRVCTELYPFLSITDTSVYLQFDLEKVFSEQIDLFSVDTSLTSDIFVINNLFSDETISTDVTLIITSLIENAFDQDCEPIHEDGYFWLTFSDIREWYGEEEFDQRMTILFPKDYEAFKDYFLE